MSYFGFYLMTKQQESEGSYYYTTTSFPYELDFVQDDLPAVSSWLGLPRKILVSSYSILKFILGSSLKLSWESLKFSVFYALFLQSRVVAFIYFLESLKDGVVKILMWRRGFLFRPTTHGGLLVLVSLALVVGSLFKSGLTAQDFTRDNVLAADNTPVTLIPEDRPRSEAVAYEVASGDTLSKIAGAYSVSVDTIKWANDMAEDEDSIKPGQSLSIPPVSGIVHKVKKGETLSGLAKKYKGDSQTIATYPYNYIDDTLELRVGETLYIPGGKMPAPQPIVPNYGAPAPSSYYVAGGSGIFAWPVKGSLNQSPSWWHPALDLGAPYGTPVSASAKGTVVTAGWSNLGFGNHVVIAHPNGYSSLYAHLAGVTVSAGQIVPAGKQIGTVGCSGFCTGPHLHFEIKRGNSHVNPLSVLP